MNTLLRSSLVSLVTGICFVAGLAIGAAILYYVPWPSNSAPVPVKSSNSSYTEAPADLEVVEHTQILEASEFLVQGTLINKGTGTWYAPTIEVEILAGSARMNSCSVHLDLWLRPSESHPFTILCRGVSGGELPENVTYKLRVRSAIGP